MKLLSALLWSSLLATMAPSAWAQANTIPSQPHLLVKGQGSRTVMPDRFGLQLNIEETDMDADAAPPRAGQRCPRAGTVQAAQGGGGQRACGQPADRPGHALSRTGRSSSVPAYRASCVPASPA